MTEIVCAAFIDHGRVLLMRRAVHRKWSANKWDLVGGHVDKGEGLDVALVRECQEEVGLRPAPSITWQRSMKTTIGRKSRPSMFSGYLSGTAVQLACWDTSIRSLAGSRLTPFLMPSLRSKRIAT
ncbi:NUDIX hydrolase [Rhizobium sp.]|uniref:NUDIX hydrolase n=1 Tax=Rhizobium sp. TaxID=391 RepID=UPI0039172CEB